MWYIVITILALAILLFLYNKYEPRIDIIVQSTREVVILWYNLYMNRRFTGKRMYKKLLTISFKQK